METLTGPYDKVGWSADEKGQVPLLRNLEQMPNLSMIKIDAAFVEDYEWGIFPVLRDVYPTVRVFADAKLIEIPSKLERRAEIWCRKATPWMLNCMAGAQSNGNYYDLGDVKGGLDGLKRFVDVCVAHEVRPCAVTVLTTVEDEIAQKQYGCPAVEQVLYYAEELVKAGFTDMVCASTEVEAIRTERQFEKLSLHTPGIRMPDSPPDDQARTLTPVEAITAGSNTLIIGRPITNGSGTPAENLDSIVAQFAHLV